MRIYDPADHTVYLHLSQASDAPPVTRHVHEECQRLPAGYANAALRVRLPAGGRPALVVLPGGSPAVSAPAPASPVLRLAQ